MLGVLHRVSEALGLVTGEILEHGGVIGDFHGDAVMGFWGWPMWDANRVQHACHAALAIHAALEAAAESTAPVLSGFRSAIGLATGIAVAGKIGTVDQVKVTAFGPVVNLAARLEGITRTFGVSTLIDAATAQAAASSLAPERGSIRPFARLRPYGVDTAHDVYELAAAAVVESQGWRVSETLRAEALAAFHVGDWHHSLQAWQAVPTLDPMQRFYDRWLRQQGAHVPDDWDGVIQLDSK